MAKDNIVQFPNKRKEKSVKEKIKIIQVRLDELNVEANYIADDIDYLTSCLDKNHKETNDLIRQLADINNIEKEALVDYITEWGDTNIFNPEKESKVKEKEEENKWDEIGDVFLDAAKKLVEETERLITDLNKNPNKDEEK